MYFATAITFALSSIVLVGEAANSVLNKSPQDLLNLINIERMKMASPAPPLIQNDLLQVMVEDINQHHVQVYKMAYSPINLARFGVNQGNCKINLGFEITTWTDGSPNAAFALRSLLANPQTQAAIRNATYTHVGIAVNASNQAPTAYAWSVLFGNIKGLEDCQRIIDSISQEDSDYSGSSGDEGNDYYGS